MGSIDGAPQDRPADEATGADRTVNACSAPVRLGVVDDHAIVLRGVRAMAEAHASALTVVWETTTASMLREALAKEPVDVILLDLWLRDGSDPIDLLTELTERGARCLIHTSELRPVPLRRIMAAGALGVVLKTDPEECLVDAIRDVVAGELAMSSEMAYLLATDPLLAAHLAPRELEALGHLASGVPRKAIGHHMDPPVGEATVTTYLSRAARRYAGMGRSIGNAFDVVREAHRDGYLDFD